MKNEKTVITAGLILGGTVFRFTNCAAVKFINRARRNG